jgi:hypothetical protein
MLQLAQPGAGRSWSLAILHQSAAGFSPPWGSFFGFVSEGTTRRSQRKLLGVEAG